MLITFSELYTNGKVNPNDIDIFIRVSSEWSKAEGENRAIHELLGFSVDEYNRWIRNPEDLLKILKSHRTKQEGARRGRVIMYESNSTK